MSSHKTLIQVANIKLSGVDKKTNDGETIVRLCNYTDIYNNSFISSEMSGEFMIASAKQSRATA